MERFTGNLIQFFSYLLFCANTKSKSKFANIKTKHGKVTEYWQLKISFSMFKATSYVITWVTSK